MKRVFCFLLSLVMLFAAIPMGVAATSGDEQSAELTSDVALEGTGSLGNMLANAMEGLADDQGEDGYAVVGLKIEGTTATVEYATMENANVLVCIYTEDSMQLVASGTAAVSNEEDFAQVELFGEMPQYFFASAYLVDTYDFSPLCAAYNTPMYTKDMQQLLASTVHDYDADKVVQLTDSTETNFAVYNDSVAVIDGGENVNVVASADYENDVYVIENADEQITSLKEGDILAYPWTEGELLIVKVASLSVSGTTATITGAELELNQVFDRMKLETAGGMDAAELDTSTLEEGVTYQGLVSGEPVEQAKRSSTGDSFQFSVEKWEQSSTSGQPVHISGKLTLKATSQIDCYVSNDMFFVEAKLFPELTQNFQISGKLNTKLSLGQISLSTNVPGVRLQMQPKLVVRCDGSAELEAGMQCQLGLQYNPQLGFRHLNKSKTVYAKVLTVEGEVYLGLDAACDAVFVHEHLLDLHLDVTTGLLMTGEVTGTLHDSAAAVNANVRHNCTECVSMQLWFVTNLDGVLTLVNSIEKFLNTQCVEKVGQWYFSKDPVNPGTGVGTCPNLAYRITVKTTDSKGKILSGVVVKANDQKVGATNSNGALVIYLSAGIYDFYAEKGTAFQLKTVTLNNAANVTLSLKTDSSSSNSVFDIIKQEEVVNDSLYKQGKWGDNITWELMYSGILYVKGTGATFGTIPCTEKDQARIKKVVIQAGITQLGMYAFRNCKNLQAITIADTVTEIKSYAFMDCSSLTTVKLPGKLKALRSCTFLWCGKLANIQLPDGLTTIEESAFHGCSSLKSLSLPASVTSVGLNAFALCTALKLTAYNNLYYLGNASNSYIALIRPVSAASTYTIHPKTQCIAGGAFGENTTLQSIVIPDRVVEIGCGAFVACIRLSSVTLGKGVKVISHNAFQDCSNLTSINIPNTVKEIGVGAFAGCNKLQSIKLPEGITAIENSAFAWCTSLASVNIPNTVKTIEDMAFSRCYSLQSIQIPASVTTIEDMAFEGCSKLKTITFLGNAPAIGEDAFLGVTANVYYPSGNASWTSSVRQNYGGQITWAATNSSKSLVAKRGVFGGEYSQDGTVRTASFTDLVPGAEYLLLVLAEMQAEEPLAADNLLFADQAVADEDGKLVFTYIQRMETDVAYVMVCGASNQNLQDATITFPNMCADVGGEHQMVSPTVVYDGKTLVEGQDYVLLGTADYTEAGTYTCYVRGIYNYAGVVECTYEVLPWSWTLQCDLEVAALEIPAGQTLDLNGKVLTVDSLASFGQIIDSVGGGGLIVEDLEITANDWLPILDSTGCYRFCEYALCNLGSKETAGGVTFGFALKLADYELLLNCEDVYVTVTLAVGESATTYAFSKELLAKYVELMTKYPQLQAAMQLHVTGMDALEENAVLTVTPGVTSVGGRLESTGAAMTYTA